jgi:hypothetical protein
MLVKGIKVSQGRPSLKLNSPVEFNPLPQEHHFALAAHCFVLAVAGDIGRCPRGKRFDYDPVQHGADGGALAVGAPRFPCVAYPVRPDSASKPVTRSRRCR